MVNCIIFVVCSYEIVVFNQLKALLLLLNQPKTPPVVRSGYIMLDRSHLWLDVARLSPTDYVSPLEWTVKIKPNQPNKISRPGSSSKSPFVRGDQLSKEITGPTLSTSRTASARDPWIWFGGGVNEAPPPATLAFRNGYEWLTVKMKANNRPVTPACRGNRGTYTESSG